MASSNILVSRAWYSSSPRRILLSTLLLVSLPLLLFAEVQDFEILLPPTDVYIHYADGFVRGPGSIDLSKLTFTALSEAYDTMDDRVDDSLLSGDDDVGDLMFPGGGTDDDNPRQLQQRQQQQQKTRTLDGGVELDASFLDIVAFHLPDDCANSRAGCDWTELGVGGRLKDGSLRWCCSQDAADEGACDGNNVQQFQRLIIDHDLFDGTSRSITVPHDGMVSKKLRSGVLDLEATGRYVVVFANCNDDFGREIMVSGNAWWKSKHGYLPGELFQFMHFYTFLWIGYIILYVWFAWLMKQNEASRIDIEKWIFMTITLGVVELTVRSIDYHTWNWAGVRSDVLTYFGIILGNMKHGISRSLIVMVSMGWGVIRDSLGSTMKKIVILSVVYFAMCSARDLTILYAVEDMQTLSYDQEVNLFDMATILTFVVSAIDVIFIMWILDALNGTMQYLENMSQTRKLDRYLKLRMIFLFAILFATIWAVFSMVDTYDEDGIVREEHEWVVEAAGEFNYFCVLVGVACLWKPNPSAKEYAYVMELSATGEGGTELELGAVPSALSDDEDDLVDYEDHDDRFQIDNAEHT